MSVLYQVELGFDTVRLHLAGILSLDIGRIICIFYAIVGVPMTLLLLSIIVRKLLIFINHTYIWFRQRFSSDRRPDSALRFLHLSSLLMLFLVVLFIIPSVIFTYLEENWSFVDAIYFCFISLTTIGLGDLVAGDSPTQRNRLFYKVCLTGKFRFGSVRSYLGSLVYLLVGVTMMMLIVALISQMPEFHLIQYFLTEKEVDDEHERLTNNETSGLLWLSHSTSVNSYGIRNSGSSQPYRRQTNDNKEETSSTKDIVTN